MMLDALAFSGLGWIGIKSIQSIKRLSHGVVAGIISESVDRFSSWADEIWKQARNQYAMIAVRDALILNRLYPPGNKRFIRIKVLQQGKVIGWAVILSTKMNGHKFFGDMRVGSVVDCLALPGKEWQIVAAATGQLEHHGVDIIVTNQLHRSWCKAFVKNGYLSGPSNFIFSASQELANKLHPFEINVSRVHMTRGDGDGPYNL